MIPRSQSPHKAPQGGGTDFEGHDPLVEFPSSFGLEGYPGKSFSSCWGVLPGPFIPRPLCAAPGPSSSRDEPKKQCTP